MIFLKILFFENNLRAEESGVRGFRTQLQRIEFSCIRYGGENVHKFHLEHIAMVMMMMTMMMMTMTMMTMMMMTMMMMTLMMMMIHYLHVYVYHQLVNLDARVSEARYVEEKRGMSCNLKCIFCSVFLF